MDGRVLVAYATKHGATTEIAEKVGQVLRQGGLSADVVRADRVGALASYDAVVLGSAVYIGRWRRSAVRLLKDNEEVLAQKPVWLFSSGPLGDADALELTKGWRFPANLRASVDRIQPRGITVFHGAVDEEKLSFIEKWLLKNTNSPIGDFRDWNVITTWTRGIVSELRARGLSEEAGAAPM